MNWRLSKLNHVTLVSNSDAHSPSKLGREANLLDCELSYDSIVGAIKSGDKRFIGTIEFFPEEGKYHFDGHAKCDLSLSPTESKKLKNICTKCGKPLVIGVAHRVH
jgi:DNA helicase-2/ATP-dependent DNA helicase PcrA